MVFNSDYTRQCESSIGQFSLGTGQGALELHLKIKST